MKEYLNQAKSIVGAPRHLARLSHVVGDAAPASFQKYLADARASAPRDVTTSEVGTLAGAAAGLVIGHHFDHWLLGVIEGASLGRNVPALFKAGERRFALCNLAQTTSGVAGSLVAKGHPVIGFLLGYLGAGLAISFTGFRGE
jgi:hypothetical protein